MNNNLNFKTMKHYSPTEVNEIKREIRTGKPVSIIADDLATKWKRPSSGVYHKVLQLSKMTRKITGEYTGPKRRKYGPRKSKLKLGAIQETLDFNPMPGSLMDNLEKRIHEITEDIEKQNATEVVKEICQEIIEKPIQHVAEIGIEVPVGVVQFTGTPSRVVIFSDHIRYYFNNQND